ncbi:MAG TPA: hypothetical protein VLA73_03715 [Burkholderiales bacterium]|nr:hypothetical protein [Burkholderiales bacterium]
MKNWATLLAGLLTAGSTFVAEILLDFNTDPLAPLAPAYTEDGFQIKRIGASHYHIEQACSQTGLITPCSRDNTLYFGWDTVGATPGLPLFRLENELGAPFTLVGFDEVAPQGSPGFLRSSKGAAFDLPSFGTAAGSVEITSDLWADLAWIEIGSSFPRGEPWGWDNVRLTLNYVPEPSTLALIAVSALLFPAIRRSSRL